MFQHPTFLPDFLSWLLLPLAKAESACSVIAAEVIMAQQVALLGPVSHILADALLLSTEADLLC